MGRRLVPHTDHVPKTLVPLRGQPLLYHQLRSYRAAGIDEVVVVRGWCGERLAELSLAGVRTVDNPGYAQTNILHSLFAAESEIDGAFVSSYGDIVFAPDIVPALLEAPGDIVITVDRDWARAYEGRTQHPASEAELCRAVEGRIRRVGKCVGPDGAHGEFIGLARYSARGAETMLAAWRRLRREYQGREHEPFADSPAFARSYLCDLFQHLIDAGVEVRHADIHGRWREIDTCQDLARAERECTFL
jgi:L-glutamine-phosphate cytidylyltransferase